MNEGYTEDEEFKWIVKQPGKKTINQINYC